MRLYKRGPGHLGFLFSTNSFGKSLEDLVLEAGNLFLKEEYVNGKNISESFYKAQADMRAKLPAYYWAAFVLVE